MTRYKVIGGVFSNYVISGTGIVFSKKRGKRVKPFKSNSGYWMVDLYFKGRKQRFYIHKLVALHYVENPENKKYIDHRDDNKLNNNYLNLLWCSQSYNIQKYYNGKSKDN